MRCAAKKPRRQPYRLPRGFFRNGSPGYFPGRGLWTFNINYASFPAENQMKNKKSRAARVPSGAERTKHRLTPVPRNSGPTERFSVNALTRPGAVSYPNAHLLWRTCQPPGVMLARQHEHDLTFGLLLSRGMGRVK